MIAVWYASVHEPGGAELARKPHPYFGFIARRTPLANRLSNRRGPAEPWLSAEQEEGVLWEAARGNEEAALIAESEGAPNAMCSPE